MTFVSYAQNYEDVMLWRALHDVQSGFYVDIGAADPTVDSVTKAFYERGWSGINVEPTASYFAELQSERPRDINLRVVAGARAGVQTLHVIEGTGLSTLDRGFAARHVDAGFVSRDVMMAALPLNQLVEPRAGQPIHFLKIDVEGAEADVLEGIDLDTIRPWIILVEATEPNSQRQTQFLWEHLLLGRGYEFAYFDGLNCFYVATEQAHLKERLAVPPNVFDDFVHTSQQQLQDDLAQQSRHAEELAQQANELEQACAAQATEITRLATEIARLETGFAQARAAQEVAMTTEIARLEAEFTQARAAQEAAMTTEIARLEAELEQAHAGQAEAAASVTRLHSEQQEIRSSRADVVAALSRSRAELVRARSELAAMEIKQRRVNDVNSELSSEIVSIIAERMRLIDATAALTNRLKAVHRSRSWRMTQPLRVASLLVSGLLGRPASAPAPDIVIGPRSPEQPAQRPAPAAAQVRAHAQVTAPNSGARHILDGRAGVILARLETARRAVSTDRAA